MSVIGIGVDVADVERFAVSLARTPRLLDTLLTATEQHLSDGRARTTESLAARFAAKEALAKALGAPAGLHWHDAQVVTEDGGRPGFLLSGTVAARAEAMGVRGVHLSLSHDGGVATAMVVLEN